MQTNLDVVHYTSPKQMNFSLMIQHVIIHKNTVTSTIRQKDKLVIEVINMQIIIEKLPLLVLNQSYKAVKRQKRSLNLKIA